MSRHPVQIHLEGELPAAQAEAAARRRMRLLESTFPAVREWEIAVRSRPATDAAVQRTDARVAATVAGGHRFQANAVGTDALGALWLAFNAIEIQLREESEDARLGAFHWFEKLKSRTAQDWFRAD
jgi:hypothetical protein